MSFTNFFWPETNELQTPSQVELDEAKKLGYFKADLVRGLDVLQGFHNTSVSEFSKTYKYSFDALKQKIGNRKIAEIGMLTQVSQLSSSDVIDASENIARELKGSLPTDLANLYKQALITKATKFHYTMLGDVALETAQDLLQKAGDVGTGVIEAGKGVGESLISISKNLYWILPAGGLILIGVYFGFFNKRKG